MNHGLLAQIRQLHARDLVPEYCAVGAGVPGSKSADTLRMASHLAYRRQVEAYVVVRVGGRGDIADTAGCGWCRKTARWHLHCLGGQGGLDSGRLPARGGVGCARGSARSNRPRGALISFVAAEAGRPCP